MSSREQNGPKFLLDNKPIGGTVDGFGGKAIMRVPLSAIGAHPGSVITSTGANEGVGGCTGVSANQTANGAAPYTVPGATVTLSLRQGTTEVASGAAALLADTTGYTGSLDVSAVPSGVYDLVTTACYAGDCSSTTTQVTI
ncbi:MAG: hypothetical protein ABR600_05320 [Actinomycetota bacterium]